jgi:glutathione peroxidase
MKLFIKSISAMLSGISLFGCFSGAERPIGAQNMKSLYDYSFTAIDGKTISLSEFRGKKMLLVNVASKCGFTSQYEDLQKLHEKYKDNLVLIGFPANNFKNQEPGTNEEIVNFCKVNYGVTFLMSEKISVIGDDQHPIYKWLTDKSLNGWNDLPPKWNFYKYLINEKSELVKVIPSQTNPMSDEIISLLK